MGPWYQADDSLGARQLTAKRLDRARVVPVYSLAMSFDEIRERVCCALRKMLGLPSGYAGYGSGPYPIGMDLWIPTNGMGDDWVVYCIGSPSKNFVIAYSIASSGDVTFDGSPTEVVQSWESMLDRVSEPAALVEPGVERVVEAADKKKSPWWNKAKKVEATDMPGSLPNLGGTKAMTDMPGSLPNAGSKLVG
jgi:hypothetical protein